MRQSTSGQSETEYILKCFCQPLYSSFTPTSTRMASQASLITYLPQITRSLVAMKAVAYALAVWESFFLSGGVPSENHFASSLFPTPKSSYPSPTPTSPTLPVIHFPWVFATFSVVSLLATTILLIKSAPASNLLTTSPPSLHSSNTPGYTRVQVCHKSDIAQLELVSVARCLVAHITFSCFLRSVVYGIVIRECFPTMAAYFTRWTAMPTWMANCAGAMTTLVTLAPVLLRRCFSYPTWFVYLDRSTTPFVCPPMPATMCTPTFIEGQRPRVPEEISEQGSEGNVLELETPTCHDVQSPLGNDATEPTRTETITQDVIGEPQHQAPENLERNMAHDYPRDRKVISSPMAAVIPEPVVDVTVEELLSGSEECQATFGEPVTQVDLEVTLPVSGERHATFNQTESIIPEQTIAVSIEEPPSLDEQKRSSFPEIESKSCEPLVPSHSLPRATAPLIEILPGRVITLAEASCPPDNVQATPSYPTPSCLTPSYLTPSCHVEPLAIPSSSSEQVLLDQCAPIRSSHPHEVDYSGSLAELPFHGEDLPLSDVLAVQLLFTHTDVLMNSPNKPIEPELSPSYVADSLLSVNTSPVTLTLEPIVEESGSSDDFSLPSTPIIRRGVEEFPALNYTPSLLREDSVSDALSCSDSPIGHTQSFDLMTSPVTSLDATTPPLSSENAVVPYNWDVYNTSDDGTNVSPVKVSSVSDDLSNLSTSFTAPRASSPLMSIRELDPAYREDTDYLSFFWTNPTAEDLAILGGDDDNLLDVYIDLSMGGLGREPPEDPTPYDDYSELEPPVAMLLDEIFPDTRWRDEDDLLGDMDLPGQPDVEDDWVLTDEMHAYMVELKNQYDARRAAAQGKVQEIPNPSFSFSHTFDSSAISSGSSSATTSSAAPVTPGINSSFPNSSPLHASAEAACVTAHLPSPLSTTPPPTMIPRARPRPKSSLMSFTSAPNPRRGLGSWR
ncbi:hypothetical protein H2248_004244 [Termitomyces sp. 'cryptogamus']|nr:hypothetical protein H2248_004244 [Termitomyces sp. 'cryptogamus']